ncbi:MAG TPA: hypothetical protein PK416_03080 [Thermodesulfobacteriota bacterium]|nr:hypothetical protein [Thermodesulfobacteriota bacterium]
MSERYEKLIRYCNFCGGNLSKEHPVPPELIFERNTSFKPEGHEAKSVKFSVAIKLYHYEGTSRNGGLENVDMCPDCLKAITLKAASQIFGWNLMDSHIAESITEAENRMKDEARQIVRLQMEQNFESLYDSLMKARRARKGCR